MIACRDTQCSEGIVVSSADMVVQGKAGAGEAVQCSLLPGFYEVTRTGPGDDLQITDLTELEGFGENFSLADLQLHSSGEFVIKGCSTLTTKLQM